MLANLDLFWLVMAVAVVAIFSFIFGLALDGLMGGAGLPPGGLPGMPGLPGAGGGPQGLPPGFQNFLKKR